MAGDVILNVGIVLLLIFVEAIFVAAEFALVSLREGQVRSLAEQGRRGAAVARLVADPNRYLGIVQILITLTSLLSSAFGAVTLSDQAATALREQGMSHGAAKTVGFLGVTLLIAFVTLVIGEQLPKRLALQRAEGTAKFVGPMLDRLATLLRPVLWLISVCTDGLVRVVGGNPGLAHEPISEEELRGLVAAHESLTPDERRLIDEVFAAGERSIGEVMVPRTEVDFLEGSMTISRAARVAAEMPHSRFPVVGEGQDDVVGFITLRELLLGEAAREVTVRQIAHEIKVLPATKPVLAAMSEMRREGHHIALVVDEYGGTDGIVTLEDLIEEVVGDVQDEHAGANHPPQVIGGAVEVDGKTNLDEVTEVSGLELPEGPYATVAGFIMADLGRLPQVGDELSYDGYKLVVVAVEGRRVARVRICKVAAEPAPGAEQTPAEQDGTIGTRG
jgi:putative hemolysin